MENTSQKKAEERSEHTERSIPVLTLRQYQVQIVAEIDTHVSIIIHDQDVLIETTEKILSKMRLTTTPQSDK